MKSQAVSDGVTFESLAPQMKYTPCVSRDAEGALVALHPMAASPRDEDVPCADPHETAGEPDSALAAVATGNHLLRIMQRDILLTPFRRKFQRQGRGHG